MTEENKKSFRLPKNSKGIIGAILKTFLLSVIAVSFIAIFALGLFEGFVLGIGYERENYLAYIKDNLMPTKAVEATPTPTIKPTPTPNPVIKPTIKETTLPVVAWGGPELWDAVNNKRSELGVNPLQKKDELCTIASIRLNELLELGKLDGHVGFSNMQDERPDLKWIFENYSTMAEFLAFGGNTPEETVNLWMNTLGHQKLLTGGEYVWGCIYSQNTFAVAIAAF